MPAELACIEERCRARFPVTEILYNCPRCGGLLETVYGKPAQSADELKALWRARRTSNAPLDQSGVWRYREFIPFLDDFSRVVTLREGCTPLLPGRRAAAAIWKARRMVGAMSSARVTRKLCLVMGRVMPVMSISWNASVPRTLEETCPVMQTMGTESSMAVAMPVTRLVAPGPEVAMATPTRPEARA